MAREGPNPTVVWNTLSEASLLPLVPGAIEDYRAPIAYFEKRLSVTPAPLPLYRHLSSNILGGLLLRAGRLDESIARLIEGMAAAKEAEGPGDWAYLALAHARTGRFAEARKWLGRLSGVPHYPRESLRDQQELALLQNEAESPLLDAEFPRDPFPAPTPRWRDRPESPSPVRCRDRLLRGGPDQSASTNAEPDRAAREQSGSNSAIAEPGGCRPDPTRCGWSRMGRSPGPCTSTRSSTGSRRSPPPPSLPPRSQFRRPIAIGFTARSLGLFPFDMHNAKVNMDPHLSPISSGLKLRICCWCATSSSMASRPASGLPACSVRSFARPPEFDQAIKTSGGERGSVGREGNGVDTVLMALESQLFLAGGGVPQSHGHVASG